jgi:lysophospholipase L1-like esterase
MTLLKKFIKFIRDAWTILGIALVLLVATELGFSLAFYIRSFWHHPDLNFRMKADTYSDPSWAARYYKELDEVEKTRTLRWKSYVYWRRIPRRGEFINITSDGLRKTSSLTASEGSNSTMKIFMFGGSTMWGLGSGDDFTIPSIFAREAKNKGIDCEVVNFGQYAYVSTQGVIELMMQLQKGNIPDAVIFYDGVNDTFGAFQLGVPGLPHDEIYREKEFGLLKRSELKTFAVQSAIKELSTMRFLNGALKKFGLRRDDIQSIPLEYEKPVSDKKTLARGVAETYLNNIKLVQALSESYGFKYIFYWQPVIYLKQHLTEYECKSLELDVNYPGLKEFYVDTYDQVRQRAADLKDNIAFHDISSIFSGIREPIYADFNHMGDKGNYLIAQRMTEDFVSLLKKKGKTTERSDATERLAKSGR